MDPPQGSDGSDTSRPGDSYDPSPTDTRRPTRYESYAVGRDDGLSESFQSTDTVRRRPEGGYGSVQSQSSTSQHLDTSSRGAQSRAHSRAARQPPSPRPGIEQRVNSTSRPRRPGMPRRATGTQNPHKGEIFSTEDDVREVVRDAVERHRDHHQQQQSFSVRRRPGPSSTLTRVQSHRSEPELDRVETPRPNDDDDDDQEDVGASEEAQDPSEHPDQDEVEDDESDGEVSDVSDAESFTLKDRQQAINETHPFGIRLWKPALYKKDRSVQKTAEGDIHSSPGLKVSKWLVFFNLLWTLLFGWWMATFAALGALVCLVFAATPSGREYGRVLWGLAGYLFYPFGKFVRLEQDEAYIEEDQGEGRSISEYEQWQNGDLEYGRLFFGPDRHRSIVGRSRRSIDSEPSETDSLLGRSGRGERSETSSQTPPRLKRRLFGRGKWNIGRVIFFSFFYALLTPSLILVSLICWFLVFTIPMGKVTMLLLDHLRRHPLALSFESDMSYARLSGGQNSSILLCTYRAVGTRYWKYTVDGTNIFLINLMGVVVFVILDWLILDTFLHLDIFITSPSFLFVAGLLSVIPLAYFIGQAVASISAQSSMGLGAAVNAFFSTVVEVFLYCVALKQGKGALVEGSIVGSIFAGVLFLPGLSMCFGAIKRKTQRFNAKSAGVTSTMLLFAVIGAFGPTLFYQIYGTHELNCLDCTDYGNGGYRAGSGARGDERDCRRCYFSQSPALNDRFYLEAVRPFCYFCACLLFLSYIIGLWFTLRTHAAVIWNVEVEEKKHEEQQSQPSIRPSGPHSFAETTGTSSGDIRESHLYRRILGQSLKQVGLQPRTGEDFTRQGSAASAGSAKGAVQTPHQVPPKGSASNSFRSGVHFPGFSDADNNVLVREVTEIAATAAAYAARDARLTRKTSGLLNASSGGGGGGASGHAATHGTPKQPAAPARAATFGDQEDLVAHAGGHGGHDAPNWSRLKSSVILLGATVLYAIVAEILVDTVDVVLEGFAIDEKFLGITLFALVPNTTEFLNAISFAMNGNIALSMEIGSAYALQVCLLQVPALVLFSAVYPLGLGGSGDELERYTFSLIFPEWDMVLVILCVFLLSYMYGEGKSNYFKGSILLLSYLVVIVGYYLSGYSQDAMGAQRFDVMGADGVYRSFKTIGRRGGSAIEV